MYPFFVCRTSKKDSKIQDSKIQRFVFPGNSDHFFAVCQSLAVAVCHMDVSTVLEKQLFAGSFHFIPDSRFTPQYHSMNTQSCTRSCKTASRRTVKPAIITFWYSR
jgi:hypothetical protein